MPVPHYQPLPHHWIYRENAGALDRTRAAVGTWLHARPRDWLAQVAAVALDPWRGNASALVAPLGHATVVVDRFPRHPAGQPGGRPGAPSPAAGHPWHRGRKRDPLYRIRKLLLTAAEQLAECGRARLRDGLAAGDPSGEIAVAWQGKELLRAVYAADVMPAARAALDRFYRWSDGFQVSELSRLARTVRAWEAEILAWHTTNGCPTAHRGRQLADQDRPCGRPPAALRPGNDTTLTVVPTHPPHQVVRLTRGVPSVWHQRPSTSDGHAWP
ncbi:MAG: Mobile element protein [Actinomycetia bacterium]|nr:Mobile element protein [Actinomycetes bacterium]